MRFRLAPLLSLLLAAALVAVVACSNESEGQPCSPDNGNNDCQDGLACVQPPNHEATNAPYVCCPPPGGASPTTSECTVNGSVEAGNPAPPDGSTVPDTSMPRDGSNDSTLEGAADGSVDGGRDSSPSGDAADGSMQDSSPVADGTAG